MNINVIIISIIYYTKRQHVRM